MLISAGPCVPTSVQTFIQCEDSIASVNWVGSYGAVNYVAVAIGQKLGRSNTCTTNTTVCSWNDLLCGEIYIVRVTASDLRCSSSPSDNTTIIMGKTTSVQQTVYKRFKASAYLIRRRCLCRKTKPPLQIYKLT